MNYKVIKENICKAIENYVQFLLKLKYECQVLYLQNVAYRSDKRAELEVHESWAEASLYCWAYATNGEEVSDSGFVGSNLIATEKS